MKFIALHFSHCRHDGWQARFAHKPIATSWGPMTIIAPSGRPPASLAQVPAWAYAAGAALLVALQASVLHRLGQPLVAASGHILLWVGNPLSPDTSQQLSDWYSFSHFIHGLIFFGLLRWMA